MTDLPTLVSELRAARPDLAVMVPTYGGPMAPFWWVRGEGDDCQESTARSIVNGVCAEALAKAGYADIFWHNNTKCYVWNNFGEHGDYIVPPCPDFTTALVRAVIALGKEADRG